MVLGGQSFSNTSPPNPFLYNGKELDKNTGYYQYGYRQYDATIGRWPVADALAEKYFDSSPYAYVLGNPVSSVDVMGLSVMSQRDEFWQEYEAFNGYSMGGSVHNQQFTEVGVGGQNYLVGNSAISTFIPDMVEVWTGSSLNHQSVWDFKGYYYKRFVPAFKTDNEFTWEDMLWGESNASCNNKNE